jgi:hypothetical protein
MSKAITNAINAARIKVLDYINTSPKHLIACQWACAELIEDAMCDYSRNEKMELIIGGIAPLSNTAEDLADRMLEELNIQDDSNSDDWSVADIRRTVKAQLATANEYLKRIAA